MELAKPHVYLLDDELVQDLPDLPEATIKENSMEATIARTLIGFSKEEKVWCGADKDWLVTQTCHADTKLDPFKVGPVIDSMLRQGIFRKVLAQEHKGCFRWFNNLMEKWVIYPSPALFMAEF